MVDCRVVSDDVLDGRGNGGGCFVGGEFLLEKEHDEGSSSVNGSDKNKGRVGRAFSHVRTSESCQVGQAEQR